MNAQSRDVTYRKIKRRLAPLLIVLYFVAFLDRVNISFASLSMNRDLGFRDSLFGLGAGIFFAGYLLFAVPSSRALVRFGARRWIAVMMVAWGLISTGMAFIQGAPLYLLFRFLLGAAEAGFFPGIILYLTRWLPGKARAGLMALFVIAIPLSSVVGAPLSNYILSLGGRGGLHGWQWLFLLEGSPAILLGLLVPALLAESPAQVTWLSPAEKTELAADLSVDAASAREGAPRADAGWRDIILNPAVIRFALQYFALTIGLYALGFWVPKLLTSRGVHTAALGWLTAVPFAAGAFGMLRVSRHSDRTGERRWHIAGSFLCAAVGMAVAAPRGPWGVALAGLALSAFGVFSVMPIFWTAVTEGIDSHLIAVTIAVVNSFGNVGGFVGPILIGMLLEHTGSYLAGLLFTSGSLLCGALLMPRRLNV